MAFPVILYDSVLRNSGATITASSSASGFPASNLHDLKPWSIWKSAVLTSPITIDIDLGVSGADNADSLGIVNTNVLAIGGTMQVFADTFTPPTTSRLAAASPTYDDVDLRTFTAPGNLRYWRVTIAHAAPPFSAAPFIGEIFLGIRTTFTEYLNPDFDPFLTQIGAASEMSEGGHYLGAVLRGLMHRGVISFGPPGAARAFYTSDLNAFIRNHAMRMRPFILQVDSADADFSRPYYLVKRADSDVRRTQVGGMWNRLNLDLQFTEAWSENP